MAERSPILVSTAPNPLRFAFEHWKRLAHAVGVVQTRFVMVVFYFIAVLPLGSLMRMSDDKLRIGHPKGTCWVPHRDEKQSLDTARRQF